MLVDTGRRLSPLDREEYFMQQNTVIIIGSGIAGLTAGVYAQMNGYRSEIFEMHDKPGGLCTSWTRRGYTFDGCIHHLAGLKPGGKMYRIWQNLGAFEDREYLFPMDLSRVERADGTGLTAYTDLNLLEREMKRIAPEDSALIDEYIRAVRRFGRVSMFDLMLSSPLELIKQLPDLLFMMKFFKFTVTQYAQRFRSPILRETLPYVLYDLPENPMALQMVFLSSCATRNFGWPQGGSLEFARAIARRYESLGGKVNYRSKVETILVENGKAVGVRLADGSEHRADTVISNADGRTTIFDMLGGKYANDTIRKYYDSAPQNQAFAVHVCLGVNRDFLQEAHALVLALDPQPELAGVKRERLDVEIYNFDSSMAPQGRTVIQVVLESSYDYWKKLKDQGNSYDAEKQALADQVIALLEKRFPGLSQQVEVISVATPLTSERFTGSFHGLQAWGAAGGPMAALKGDFTQTLPGLENFYMAGQWAGATIGLPVVAMMGRKIIQRICKRDGKKFND
jgi:phytoene dehydrogenase-like protein